MSERRPSIRHIATSLDGSCFAVAEFEKHVQVWDLDTSKRITAFKTTLDFGGRRLAISQDSRVLAVGSYHKHGVAAYEIPSGRELWRREDLRKIQVIYFSLDNQWVSCETANPDIECVNVATGKSPSSIEGISKVWESPYDPIRILCEHYGGFRIVDLKGKKLLAFRGDSSKVLDHTFAPGSMCISYMGAAVNCFAIDTGKLRWRYSTKPGTHALRISHIHKTNTCAAIIWSYENGGPVCLVHIDAETGEQLETLKIDEALEFEFAQRGTRLITSSGLVYDVESMKQVDWLDFFDADFCKRNGIIEDYSS